MQSIIGSAVNDMINAIDEQLYARGYRENEQEAAELVSMLGDEEKVFSERFVHLAENLCSRVLPGLQMFVRDVNLPEEIAGKYSEGMIIRSPAFTDASRRNGGMVTSHRYAILSNHMADMSAITGEADPRGLAVARCGSYFQVLRIYRSKSGETMLLLLHLPDDGSWPFFERSALSVVDDIIDDSIDRFENGLIEPPVEELTTADWFERCSAPIGINEDGSPVEL